MVDCLFFREHLFLVVCLVDVVVCLIASHILYCWFLMSFVYSSKILLTSFLSSCMYNLHVVYHFNNSTGMV